MGEHLVLKLWVVRNTIEIGVSYACNSERHTRACACGGKLGRAGILPNYCSGSGRISFDKSEGATEKYDFFSRSHGKFQHLQGDARRRFVFKNRVNVRLLH